MLLRGVRFNYAFDQSGIRNFDGSGWPYHRFFKRAGLTFENCTFVAKTTTLEPRAGNMKLREDGLTPVDFRPDCIVVRFRQGVALNAVGLSGPGLAVLLEKGCWYKQCQPFMISLALMEQTPVARLQEISAMARMIRQAMPFSAPPGIQLNISCPNVAHEPQQVANVVSETKVQLRILRELGNYVPLVPKINALFDVAAAAEICDDENCDGLVNSNTLPWAEVPVRDLVRLFGSIDSPLEKYGGGGLSGSYLLHEVDYWLRRARYAGITKPIIAGGGILHPRDVDRLVDAGASAIAVGSVAFLRPWRVQRIINRANRLGDSGQFYGG